MTEQDGPTIIRGLTIDPEPEAGVSISHREWMAYCSRVERLGRRSLTADDDTLWFGISVTAFLAFLVPAISIPLTSKNWSSVLLAVFIVASTTSAVAALRFWLRVRRPQTIRVNLAQELADEMRAISPSRAKAS